MTPTGSLRTATRADIPAIWRVRLGVRENRLSSRTISDEDVRRAIEDTGRGWVVTGGGPDDPVVGFAIGQAGTGQLWALFVLPQAEGRGNGARLHAATVGWLWSLGRLRLWLTTDPGTRAARFYERQGWRLAGPAAHGEVRYELDRPA